LQDGATGNNDGKVVSLLGRRHMPMIIKARSVAWGLVLVLAPTAASIASADCVIVSFDVRDAFRNSDVVFSGIVTNVDDINDRLSFRVDRVWNGPVGRDIWIYQLDIPFIGSYVFRPRPDIRYIIFARKLSADDRKFLNKIDEPIAFGIQRTCGDGPRFSSEYARQLDKLSRGRRPRN
jgi:hypothetical protein